MIGLPGETMDDVLAIAAICRRVLEIGRRRHGGRAQVKANVSTFVPKVMTPFQWDGQDRTDEIEAKVDGAAQGAARQGSGPVVARPAELAPRGGPRPRRSPARSRSSFEPGGRARASMPGTSTSASTLWLEAFAEEGLDPAWYAQRDIPTERAAALGAPERRRLDRLPAARTEARSGRQDHGRLPLGPVLELRRAGGDRLRLRHGRAGSAPAARRPGRRGRRCRRRWPAPAEAMALRGSAGRCPPCRNVGRVRRGRRTRPADVSANGERRPRPRDAAGHTICWGPRCSRRTPGSKVSRRWWRRPAARIWVTSPAIVGSGETTLELIRLFVLLVGAAALVTLLARRIKLPYTVALVGVRDRRGQPSRAAPGRDHSAARARCPPARPDLRGLLSDRLRQAASVHRPA